MIGQTTVKTEVLGLEVTLNRTTYGAELVWSSYGEIVARGHIFGDDAQRLYNRMTNFNPQALFNMEDSEAEG